MRRIIRFALLVFTLSVLLAAARAEADAAIAIAPEDGESVADAFSRYVRENGALEPGWHLLDAGGTGAETGEEASYTVVFADQEGNPVPGCALTFCTDELCMPAVADETGTARCSGAPEVYHLQVIRVPEGYECDGALDFYTQPFSQVLAFAVTRR